MASLRRQSPYLASPDRLADVIAAIQATATYRYYKRDFQGWADRISGDSGLADHWRRVLEEHPEFFRLDSSRQNASLVWRRQHPKRYDVDSGAILTKSEYDEISEARRDRISRTPLGEAEIEILIRAAIDLHSRAIDQKREVRWWIPTAAGLLGALVGAAVKS